MDKLETIFGYFVLAIICIGFIGLMLTPFIHDWEDRRYSKKLKSQNNFNPNGGLKMNIHIHIKKDK